MTGEILVMKSVEDNFTSHAKDKRGDRLNYPEAGCSVSSSFWDPSPACGDGIHGFVWGAGGPYSYSDTDDSWVVLSVNPAQSYRGKPGYVEVASDSHFKCKFRRGKIAFRGTRKEALTYMWDQGIRGILVAASPFLSRIVQVIMEDLRQISRRILQGAEGQRDLYEAMNNEIARLPSLVGRDYYPDADNWRRHFWLKWIHCDLLPDILKHLSCGSNKDLNKAAKVFRGNFPHSVAYVPPGSPNPFADRQFNLMRARDQRLNAILGSSSYWGLPLVSLVNTYGENHTTHRMLAYVSHQIRIAYKQDVKAEHEYQVYITKRAVDMIAALTTVKMPNSIYA